MYIYTYTYFTYIQIFINILTFLNIEPYVIAYITTNHTKYTYEYTYIGPSHWIKFVNSLEIMDTDGDRLKNEEDNGEKGEEDIVVIDNLSDFKGSRIGHSLPICCPRHSDTLVEINLNHTSSSTILYPSNQLISNIFPTNETWNTFCNKSCTFIKPFCSHLCGLSCHSPIKKPHILQSECTDIMIRPCDTHSTVPLLCKDIEYKVHDTPEIALNNFKCQINEPYNRPECDHIVKLPCHKLKLIKLSLEILPNCIIKVNNFIQPSCGHIIIAPTCIDCRNYEIKPPQCNESVCYTRKCGCKIDMPCYQKDEELNNPKKCQKSIQKQRPRCSHMLSLRCHIGSELSELWDEQDKESININNQHLIIESHIVYGPSESDLLESARIVPCKVDRLLCIIYTYKHMYRHIFI